MSKASNISSLSELRERREEIKVEQQAARRGLTTTLAAAPQKAKEYALEDLALPALGIGLAAYVGYRVLRSKDRHEPDAHERTHHEPVPMLPARQLEQPAETYPLPSAASRRYQEEIRRDTQDREKQETVQKGLSFATVVAAGKILIPAAQAIIGAIQKPKSNQQHAAEQPAETDYEVVNEVETT